MPLGTEVGLGPGDIAVDGDRAPHEKGDSSPHFCGLRTQAVRINRRPCLLWPNSWMDRYTTWCEGRPRPGDIALDGTQLYPPFSGRTQFCGREYLGNGLTDHYEIWHGDVY